MKETFQKTLFVFDFDSTLVTIESLDELIKESLRKKDQEKLIPKVDEIMNMGMNGEISLQESIHRRLALAKLKDTDIHNFQTKIIQTITPGIKKIINWLQNHGHVIFIISGGFLDCILPVAKKLDIPAENCLGNTYSVDQNGFLNEVDETNPLMKSNGKCVSINKLKEKLNLPVVIVGDGISDLIPWQNKKAEYFLGFGINIHRPKIEKLAENYFTKTEDLFTFIKNNF